MTPQPIPLWHIQHCKILLENYVALASIGVYDFEKTQRQRISVDIEVTLDIDKQHRLAEDDITHVVDYDYLRNGVHHLLEAQHFSLQETLCEKILELCFEKTSVLHARVHTRKLDVYSDCKSIGIEMLASRAPSPSTERAFPC